MPRSRFFTHVACGRRAERGLQRAQPGRAAVQRYNRPACAGTFDHWRFDRMPFLLSRGLSLAWCVWYGPACIGEGAGCRLQSDRLHDAYGAAVCPQKREPGDRIQTDNSMARQAVRGGIRGTFAFFQTAGGPSAVARTTRTSCCSSPAAERFRMEARHAHARVWSGTRKKAPAGQGPLVTEETARTSTCRPCRPCRPCHQACRERPSWVRACR